jgi:hypothetical protein
MGESSKACGSEPVAFGRFRPVWAVEQGTGRQDASPLRQAGRPPLLVLAFAFGLGGQYLLKWR